MFTLNTFWMPLSEHKNRLIIAAAGSGKTTFLVSEALKCKEPVLITTYTLANESEIKKKIIELNKYIPSNITVQTFFSFLLQHGVRPYQGTLYKSRINGMLLTNQQSGIKYKNSKGFNVLYAEEDAFDKHYFTNSGKIYSDKISKFIIRSNDRSGGSIIDRLSRIYPNIFFDEVQDLAGYDLEIIKLLFASKSRILLVGDPRQVTYLTHHDKKHSGYKDGKIEDFILKECKKLNCFIDKETLSVSHRNNAEICFIASNLYNQYPASNPCDCPQCRSVTTDHEGVFIIQAGDLPEYIEKYRPTVLRYSGSDDKEWNFGASKGLGFERVLIYPTKAIFNYLRDGKLKKTVGGKEKEAFDIAKFYVAVTRARRSAAIVAEFEEEEKFIPGLKKYDRNLDSIPSAENIEIA